MTGTHVRLPDELWRRIDAYRRSHPAMPSRPGAIKELVERRLDDLVEMEMDAKPHVGQAREPDR